MSGTADGIWTADSDVTADTPPNSTFSAEQYAQAARNLFPRGRAWSSEDGASSSSASGVTADGTWTADQGKTSDSGRRALRMRGTLDPSIDVAPLSARGAFCDALGAIYAHQDADCVAVLEDFFPATATAGLAEWNASLGLPDACSGVPANQQVNQQQIIARLIASGGQDVPYYEALAAALGFDVSISEFNATHQGTDPPAGFITTADDWAHSWRVNVFSGPADTTELECLLERYKPAHTQFYIVIGASPPPTARLFNVTDNVSEPLLVPPS